MNRTRAVRLVIPSVKGPRLLVMKLSISKKTIDVNNLFILIKSQNERLCLTDKNFNF